MPCLYFSLNDFAYLSKSANSCICILCLGVAGRSGYDNPLLSMPSYSCMKFTLLRLCMVMVDRLGGSGAGIKNSPLCWVVQTNDACLG